MQTVGQIGKVDTGTPAHPALHSIDDLSGLYNGKLADMPVRLVIKTLLDRNFGGSVTGSTFILDFQAGSVVLKAGLVGLVSQQRLVVSKLFLRKNPSGNNSTLWRGFYFNQYGQLLQADFNQFVSQGGRDSPPLLQSRATVLP